MKCLYIDLASNKGLLALVMEQSVAAAEHIDHRVGDHELMPRLENLLRVAGCGFHDLTQIACVIGPGGFMSLRVGVALANVLSDRLDTPVAGIHLSDLYAARIPPPLHPSPNGGGEGGRGVLWLHSTKKQELFVRSLDPKGQWPEATHMKLEDFLQSVEQPMHWIGELIPEHQVAIATVGTLYAMSPQDMEQILPAFLHRQVFKKQILEPWYGRGW